MHRSLAVVALAAAVAFPASAVGETVVCIQPVGKHDASLLDPVAAGVRALYGLDVRTLPPVAMPKAAYHAPRKRWRAERILAFLDEKVVPASGCTVVVGFTALDVSTTKDKHEDWGVLGLASIGGPSAVVSSFRMRRRVDHRGKAIRAVKVVNHELGHVLGLDHCPTKGCVMSDAKGTIRTVDRESGLLCAESRRAIEARHGVALPAPTVLDWNAIVGR